MSSDAVFQPRPPDHGPDPRPAPGYDEVKARFRNRQEQEAEALLARVRSGEAAQEQEAARTEAEAAFEKAEGQRLLFERQVSEEAARRTAERVGGRVLPGSIDSGVAAQVRREFRAKGQDQ